MNKTRTYCCHCMDCSGPAQNTCKLNHKTVYTCMGCNNNFKKSSIHKHVKNCGKMKDEKDKIIRRMTAELGEKDKRIKALEEALARYEDGGGLSIAPASLRHRRRSMLGRDKDKDGVLGDGDCLGSDDGSLKDDGDLVDVDGHHQRQDVDQHMYHHHHHHHHHLGGDGSHVDSLASGRVLSGSNKDFLVVTSDLPIGSPMSNKPSGLPNHPRSTEPMAKLGSLGHHSNHHLSGHHPLHSLQGGAPSHLSHHSNHHGLPGLFASEKGMGMHGSMHHNLGGHQLHPVHQVHNTVLGSSGMPGHNIGIGGQLSSPNSIGGHLLGNKSPDGTPSSSSEAANKAIAAAAAAAMNPVGDGDDHIDHSSSLMNSQNSSHLYPIIPVPHGILPQPNHAPGLFVLSVDSKRPLSEVEFHHSPLRHDQSMHHHSDSLLGPHDDTGGLVVGDPPAKKPKLEDVSSIVRSMGGQ